MLPFIPKLSIELDKPGILDIKSKGYRLSMSSWNKVYDKEDWFNLDNCSKYYYVIVFWCDKSE